MIDNKFEQILFLVCKSLINSELPTPKLELYREVKNNLVSMFGYSEPIKFFEICGKEMDFTDILHVILVILIELGLVYKKETDSISFKWVGIKGFTTRYLATNGLIQTNSLYENTNCLDKKIQIFARILLSYLIMEQKKTLDKDLILYISNKCSLTDQNHYIDSVISSFLFLNYLIRESDKLVLNYDFFNHSAKNLKNEYVIMDETSNKPLYTEPEKFTIYHNNIILERSKLWADVISKVAMERERKMKEKIAEKNKKYEKKQIEMSKNVKVEEEKDDSNNIIPLITSLDSVNEKLKDAGYALLKGSDWSYYMKDLSIIIGRKPEKHGVRGIKNCEDENVTWEVDLDLGSHKRVSKQHAFLAFNFLDNCFEIKNISTKHSIFVNDEEIKPWQIISLSSRSIIKIGSIEFYFLLPVEN